MKFEIKRIEIIDDPDLEAEVPQFAQCHVEIGDRSSLGADIFFVDVCNPQWAREHLDPDGEAQDSRVLIVERIDEKNIREKVEQKFLDCEYGSFDDLVSRAAPLMKWEFA